MATNTMVALQTVTLSSPQASVTFGSGGTIPQGYTDLRLVATPVTANASTDTLGVKINSLTSYSRTYMIGNGSTATSGRQTSEPYIYVDGVPTSSPSMFASLEFMNYSNATTYKTVLSRLTNPSADTRATVYLSQNTSAITSITLVMASGSNIAAGSTFTLYGIAAAGIGGDTTPHATGGDIIATDGTYWIHTFLSSGTFTPNKALSCEYVVIAGGGGSTGANSGAAGAGGYRSSVVGEMSGGGASAESKFSAASGTGYTVVVGAGGAVGNQGSSSSFATITSIGGGTTAGSGGSGGGANYSGGSGGSGTTGQGYAGGSVPGSSANYGTGGGGGAGGPGGNKTTVGGNGGAGGVGVISSITGTPVERAGGGGGGSEGGTAGVATGGGGNGVSGTFQTTNPGKANTGGGAGGTSGGSGNYGAAGGSGIVIVRYAI